MSRQYTKMEAISEEVFRRKQQEKPIGRLQKVTG